MKKAAIEAYLSQNASAGKDGVEGNEDYFPAFRELFHWHKKGEALPSQIKQHENYLHLQGWLKSMFWPGATADDILWLVEWVNTQSTKAKGFGIKLCVQERLIDWAPMFLAELLADRAHHKLISNVEVQLDNGQLKHQPNNNPIGDRSKGGGEKFADDPNDKKNSDRSSKSYHETTTMKFMAAWANSLVDIPQFKKIYIAQGERFAVSGHDKEISFDGFCILIGTTRHVSFHCYPNTR